MRYDLRRADVAIRWLVTCLLATFGIAYLFGGIMVRLYAGFTPARVAATYGGEHMAMAMPPDTTMVVHRVVSLSDFSEGDVHTVDTDLLVQDTHVHVPMYGVIAAVLSLVALGLGLSNRATVGLVTVLFAAPWLDFAGMWLTKLAGPGFAWVTLAGGYAMGLGYLAVTAIAIPRMWLGAKGGQR